MTRHWTTLRSVVVLTVLWLGTDTAVYSQRPNPAPALPPLRFEHPELAFQWVIERAWAGVFLQPRRGDPVLPHHVVDHAGLVEHSGEFPDAADPRRAGQFDEVVVDDLSRHLVGQQIERLRRQRGPERTGQRRRWARPLGENSCVRPQQEDGQPGEGDDPSAQRGQQA